MVADTGRGADIADTDTADADVADVQANGDA